MLSGLMFKEFKNGFVSDKFKKGNVLNTILNFVVSLLFIAVEISLYAMLNKKLMVYKQAPIHFLVIFLSIISALMIMYSAVSLRKSLFDVDDNKVLITKPVHPLTNVISKVLFLYFNNVLRGLVLATPILCVFAYGYSLAPRFYVLMFFYPFVMSLFECGIASLLVLVLQPLYKFLKAHFIVQTIVSLTLIICLCLGYSYILNMFLKLIQNNSLSTIFTTETLEKFGKISVHLLPIYFFMYVLSEKYIYLLYMILFSLPFLLFGVFMVQYIYRLYIKKESENNIKVSKHYKMPKILKPETMLLKKEFQLLFSSTEVFSYTGLFVMQPFLTVLVVKAMNVIFSTGALSYVISYFPFMSGLIQIVFILLFSGYINTSCSAVISKEGAEGIRICKTIPVSYKKQLLIKMVVPLAVSTVSLLITNFVLLITKDITFVNSVFAFFLAIVLDILLEVILVNSDLTNPSGNSEKEKSNSYIELVSIFVPILIVGLIFVLSYVGLPFFASFLIMFALMAVITLVVTLVFMKKASLKFLALEMRN